MFMPIYNSYWHGMSVHVFMLVMTTTTKTVVETETLKKWTKNEKKEKQEILIYKSYMYVMDMWMIFTVMNTT